MNIGLEVECCGNGEHDFGPERRSSDIAHDIGTKPAAVRDIIVSNAANYGAHKDSGGKWAMRLLMSPELTQQCHERGLELNPTTTMLITWVAELNKQNAEKKTRISELTTKQSELQEENKELNEKLVRISADSVQKANDITNNVIELAKKAVERPTATPLPPVESPKQAESDIKESQSSKSIQMTLGPLVFPIPRSFVPVTALAAAFAAGLFVAHLYNQTQQQAVLGANQMISTSLNALSDVNQREQGNLEEERKAVAASEKHLSDVQSQQTDITKQLYQSQADLKAMGNEKDSLKAENKNLKDQVGLLDSERQRRADLEKTLEQSLGAQKKLAASQSEVISDLQAQVDALRKQVLAIPPKSTDSPKTQDNGAKK